MAKRTRFNPIECPEFPDLAIEARVGRGAGVVCGVDEAGRGPWAGPVAVAAVILDPARPIEGLNDSKKLTGPQRERLYAEICRHSHVSVVFASSTRIDVMNIRAATLWAMREAVSALAVPPDHVLIDGRDVPPGLTCPGEAVIKGDARSQSIAAASIVAKVSRDRLMQRIGATFPGYGFERHMGYGVPEHAAALQRYGATPLHRRSFKPIADVIRFGAAGITIESMVEMVDETIADDRVLAVG
jgi:ribonuclease HII